MNNIEISMNKKLNPICIIIKSNRINLDHRVQKEYNVLDPYYNLVYLGWNREDSDLNKSSKYNVINFNLKSPYGKRILFYLPAWWIKIFYWLLTNEWDLVHVINYDSLIPALLAAKFKNKKILYEILETYEDRILEYPSIRKLLMNFDKRLMKICDGIILVDEEQINEFNGIPNDNYIVVYDSPDLSLISDSKKFSSLFNKNNFNIFIASGLYKLRKLNIEKLINAVGNFDDVNLIIAGYGDMVKEIEEIVKSNPERFFFLGRLDIDEVLECYNRCDISVVLRDWRVPIYKYICGSTLFNSMIVGKPLIVNHKTSTAIKVQRFSCGIIIDVDNDKEILDAIQLLKNNKELRSNLGKQGKIAYEDNFQWPIVSNNILKIYKNIIGN